MLDWFAMITLGRNGLHRRPEAALVPIAVAVLCLVASCAQAHSGPSAPQAPSPTEAASQPISPHITSRTAQRPEAASLTTQEIVAPIPLAQAFSPSATPSASKALPPLDRDLSELAERFRPHGDPTTARLGPTSSPITTIGQQRDFFVSNLIDGTVHTVTATLKVISEHAYWFLDDKIEVPVEDLETSSRIYEQRVHPTVVGTFGDISSPGVDGDPHLIILHTSLVGAAGYYSSKDEFTRHVHPHSNLAEIIYLDTKALPPGTDIYLGVIAHELQHAIHWNQDPGEEAWVNEGLSEVATEIAGYPTHFAEGFLRRPNTQLNWWPDQPRATANHYGASGLFFSYLSQRYGGVDGLGQLVREQLDGIEGVDAYLARHGTSFEALFQDWVVANYLDAHESPYGYPDREVGVVGSPRLLHGDSTTSTLPQFSTRYHKIAGVEGDVVVRFSGATTVHQFATECYSLPFCWSSGRGDSINSTMTRQFDLAQAVTATLEFMVWHDIERGWDFAYVEASGDDGLTWDILDATHTTSANPSGNSYGQAYTGHSRGWVRESIDLTRYTGGNVMVRFEYITDDAVYLDGLVIDDIALPEIGFFDQAKETLGWDARGFELVDGLTRQRFAVKLIESRDNGEVRVVPMDLDRQNNGELLIRGVGNDVVEAIIVVSPMTRRTHHPASYRIALAAP